MSKLTEAINNFKNTKNTQNLYREVLSAKIKLSEAESVLKETLGVDFSKENMMNTFEEIMIEDLMNSDTETVTTKDYE